MENFQITSLSDRSVLVNFGNLIDPKVNEKVLSLHRKLQQSGFEGFIESVPAYASLAVFYDVREVKKQAGSTAFSFVKKILGDLLKQTELLSEREIKIIKIPVCYTTDFGTDITQLAESRHLSISEIISLHTSVLYRVYMIGFLPGFAYMGTVDEKLIAPRKDKPALIVPAGSVGIAGSQTGIYPFDSPGGWQVIGRTPLRLFDTKNLSPCLLTAGDTVQFFSIDKNEFEQLYGH